MIDTSNTRVIPANETHPNIYETRPIDVSTFTRSVILRKVQSIIKNENRNNIKYVAKWIRDAFKRIDSNQFRNPSNDDLVLIKPFDDHVLCVKGIMKDVNVRYQCWCIVIYEKQIVCQYIASYKDELNEVLSGLVVI